MNSLNDILKDRVIKEVHTEENTILIYLKPTEQSLPKSWKEFCEINPLTSNDCFITQDSSIGSAHMLKSHEPRLACSDKNLLPNFEIAEAVLALCQLIQLRDCYNGDWVPDWKDKDEIKHIIQFDAEEIHCDTWLGVSASPLYFKSEELRDEFLRYFRPLIEKLKPLYDIKKGGAE